MNGEKKCIRCEDVRVIKVPQYEGLTVEAIKEFAENKIDIESYLPSYDYSKEPNREWLCNIVNSLIHEEFLIYINKKIEEKKNYIIQNQNLKITAKEEFINIFKA